MAVIILLLAMSLPVMHLAWTAIRMASTIRPGGDTHDG